MKAILAFTFRWIANLWVLLVFICIGLWLVVARGVGLTDPRWLVINYITPFWFILFFFPPLVIFLFLRLFKRLFAVLAVYFIFVIGFGDTSLVRKPAFQFEEGVPTQTIKVVAINLRYYSFGFEEIVKALNQMDMDFYLLSENQIKEEQLVAIKEKLAPKQFYMGQQESTAIISKYPVISFKEVKFPTRQASLHSGNKIEQMHLNPFRSFAHAIVDVNGTHVHAISVRFIAGRGKSRDFNDVLRFGFYLLEAQQKEIAFFLEYLKSLEGPVIYGGDLNATPSSIVIKKLTDISTDFYMQDHIWGTFTFGTTYPPKTNSPVARLDYLFGMNEVELIKSELLPVVISDHYPVYAECLIPLNTP